ncbi:MAG: RNA 2',3'-cyclic phosphodiesterase [Rectinema sp.]
MRRMFLALLPPEKMVMELSRYTTCLKPFFSGARVDPTPPDSYHLTLLFLGELNGGTVGDFRNSLDNSLAAFADGDYGRAAPVALESTGLAFLPDHGAPRVVCVDFLADPPAGLAETLRKCADAAHASGIAIDERPWRAHLTIGRVRSDRLAERNFPPPPHLSFSPSGFTLMESFLRPSGPEYIRIAEFPLASLPPSTSCT